MIIGPERRSGSSLEIKLLLLFLLGILEDEFDEDSRQRAPSYERGTTHAYKDRDILDVFPQKSGTICRDPGLY